MPEFHLPPKDDVFAIFDREATELRRERKTLAADDVAGHARLDAKLSQNGYLRQRLFDALLTAHGETAAQRMTRMSKLPPGQFDLERLGIPPLVAMAMTTTRDVVVSGLRTLRSRWTYSGGPR